MSVTIYHNPACGTSRNTLAMIRQSGEEPEVIEYLKTPPSRARLIELIKAMGISVRALLRQKGHALCGTGPCRPQMERRPVDRFHAGASDPDQPADRGDAKGHKTVPALRSRARSARQSRPFVRERRRRGRDAREIVDGFRDTSRWLSHGAGAAVSGPMRTSKPKTGI